jgi:GT2 family glycosyltransferase
MLSVIIVNFNGGAYIRRCLESLERNFTGVEHEVCVVDNASSDGSADEVATRFPHVTVVRNSENGGFSHGINAGLAHTRGDIVMWLNPDTEVLDAGIGNLLGVFEDDEAVGIVGPQIVSNDGKVQLSCRSWPTYRTALFNRYSLLTRLFPDNPHSREYLKSDWAHTSTREVDWVSGCCFLHRRQAADEIGGLDETFFMYCEDVDFCRRARSAGWTTVYSPAMRVLHHIAGSTRSVRRRMIIERHRSMWRYYRKHFGGRGLKGLAVAAGIGCRTMFKLLESAVSPTALP